MYVHCQDIATWPSITEIYGLSSNYFCGCRELPALSLHGNQVLNGGFGRVGECVHRCVQPDYHVRVYCQLLQSGVHAMGCLNVSTAGLKLQPICSPEVCLRRRGSGVNTSWRRMLKPSSQQLVTLNDHVICLMQMTIVHEGCNSEQVRGNDLFHPKGFVRASLRDTGVGF